MRARPPHPTSADAPAADARARRGEGQGDVIGVALPEVESGRARVDLDPGLMAPARSRGAARAAGPGWGGS